MTPERRRRMVELAEWHRDWTERRLSNTGFHPDTNDAEDYNMHYVDVEADDDAFHTRARQIMGIDNQ